MKMRRCMSLFVVLVLILSFALTAFAQGGGSSAVNIDDENIINNMNHLGIEKSVQAKLLKNIKRGILPDSENPDKIKEIAHKLKISEENPYIKHTFPDGSVIALEAETQEILEPLASVITKEVLIQGSSVLQRAEYKAYIRIALDYPDSYIFSVYDERITMHYGYFWDPNLRIIRAAETSSNPAHARLSYYWHGDGYVYHGSGTTWLELYVGNGTWSAVLDVFQ